MKKRILIIVAGASLIGAAVVANDAQSAETTKSCHLNVAETVRAEHMELTRKCIGHSAWSLHDTALLRPTDYPLRPKSKPSVGSTAFASVGE